MCQSIPKLPIPPGNSWAFDSVLSISFEVDVPTGKVGGSLFFECQRRELPRGVWGHAPPENFEIQMLGNAIFNVLQTVLRPKR